MSNGRMAWMDLEANNSTSLKAASTNEGRGSCLSLAAAAARATYGGSDSRRRPDRSWDAHLAPTPKATRQNDAVSAERLTWTFQCT